MNFLLHPNLPSQVILGPRVAPGIGSLANQSQVQPVITAIVKGTFAADDPSTTPLPSDQQLPIWVRDVFFNQVRNADFSEGTQVDAGGNLITPVTAWTSEGPVISQSPLPTDTMTVQGAGRVVQPLEFHHPLGGRPFRLSFRAMADANVTLSDIKVESASGVELLGANHLLTPAMTTFVAPAAMWPAGLQDTEARLVLIGSNSATIIYEWVQLSEGNTLLGFDASDPIRYEHDLATFKPRTDIVVLGAPSPLEPGPSGGTWNEQVLLNGDSMPGIFPDGTRVTFGWQSRIENGANHRKTYAGDGQNFDPATMQLPLNFNNLFNNGGLFQNANGPVLTHPAPGSTVTVNTSGLYDIGGGATETRTQSRELYLPNPGPQALITFRTGSAANSPMLSQPLTMNVDTIVYDKNTNQFYAVWRGVWDFESIPADRYVSLAIS
jgi:hypothetical protein